MKKLLGAVVLLVTLASTASACSSIFYESYGEEFCEAFSGNN